MNNQPKSKAEIESMRNGGAVLKSTLMLLKTKAVPGVSTKELADIAATQLKKHNMKPAFLGYHGFPDVLCVSINDEVVHGIPSKNKILKNGDIVSFDFGVVNDGLITDGAITVGVGEISSQTQKLIDMTKESLQTGIKQLKSGIDTGTLGNSIEQVLNKAGLGIVRTFVGHGVGHNLHEAPEIPNYGTPGTGVKLIENMTIAIEPMSTQGDEEVIIDSDGWTVRTKDGSLSAHFEDTVLITKNGAEILTSA